MKLKHKQTLAALLASVSLSAMADVGDPSTTCDAGNLTALSTSPTTFSGPADCSGPDVGNLQDSGVLNFVGIFGATGSFAFVGRGEAGGPGGPFADFVPDNSGDLDFLAERFGSFVVGLETIDGVGIPNKFSYYLFNGLADGVEFVEYDTLGVSITQTFEARDLVAATLYANDATPPVPEPETYALMLAGLGVLGFMARRRAS